MAPAVLLHSDDQVADPLPEQPRRNQGAAHGDSPLKKPEPEVDGAADDESVSVFTEWRSARDSTGHEQVNAFQLTRSGPL